MPALGLLVLFALTGCADLIPSPEIRHDVKDIKRKREAQKWAGTYSFSECAQAGDPCWAYVIVVDADADAVIRVEGPQPTPALKATARVFKNDQLTLTFAAYAGEIVDPADVGLHVFDPARGRYSPGQRLAQITRPGSGRPCLAFDGMDSKLASKVICAAP